MSMSYSFFPLISRGLVGKAAGLILLLLLSTDFRAQEGAKYIYSFLRLSPSARITALGGNNVSIVSADPSVVLHNPAALNPAMHRSVLFSGVVYPGQTHHGQAGYTHDFKKAGVWQFGIQYLAYGRQQAADVSGNVTGSFQSGDMCIYGSGGWRFARILSVGATTKLIYSQLGPYSSVGMAVDIGFTVHDSARLITASLVARNAGIAFKPHVPGSAGQLPFDLIAGISLGLKKTPFRLHVQIHDLHNWDLTYADPDDQSGQNLFSAAAESSAPKKNIADEIFRHIIFGLEADIKKVVRLSLAYNHQRQRELILLDRRGAPGLSGGLGLKIKQFDFGYGFSLLSQGASQHHFTLSVKTDGFIRRKSPQ